MRVLTWNLFHGRAVPERRYSLTTEFVAALSGWEWDVALLQEVPPWWPPLLASACGADERHVLTSRNSLLTLRRALAERRPDIAKSSGGGANAILVRPSAGEVTAHAQRRLRIRPERRRVHAVRLELDEGPLWIANVHAQVRPHSLTRADLRGAGRAVQTWAGGEPHLLAGDLNVPDPEVAGFNDAGGHEVDRFLLGPGVAAAGRVEVLERPGGLSDHAPVAIDLRISRRNES